MSEQTLRDDLTELRLWTILEQYTEQAAEAIDQQRSPVDFLERLVAVEAQARRDRAATRRLKAARFPVLKTLDSFQWDWPSKIDRIKIQHLFRLQFLDNATNVVFIGGVGLGKTHLITALAYHACQAGHSVLFTTAVEAVNQLVAAQAAGRLKSELTKYTKPQILCLDEVGYIPIDKLGADLLFQIISQRYERGSILLSTNRPYKKWAQTFNNDTTLTSALLDRLLHHAETLVIQGRSYRTQRAELDN